MDHVEFYGMDWLDETYKYIIEDKRDHYLTLKALAPISRTPMDKDGAKSLQDYDKQLEKMFRSWTPWDVKKWDKSYLRSKVKSGTIVVIPDGSDNLDDPLYKDATILKR